jgi:hypothetical protein
VRDLLHLVWVERLPLEEFHSRDIRFIIGALRNRLHQVFGRHAVVVRTLVLNDLRLLPARPYQVGSSLVDQALKGNVNAQGLSQQAIEEEH